MDQARVRQLSRELEDLGLLAETIRQKYAAHFQLHDAACKDGDEGLVKEYRQSLHVLLDRLLDNGEKIQKLTNEVRVLTRPA